MSEHRQIGAAPTVRPGEIWLVEQAPDTDFAPLDRDAVLSANVILYDRTLEPLVAEILPLGTYAEPLPGGGQGTGPAISPRALRFAAEGWSVVQVVASWPGWRERVHGAGDALAPSARQRRIAGRGDRKSGRRPAAARSLRLQPAGADRRVRRR